MSYLSVSLVQFLLTLILAPSHVESREEVLSDFMLIALLIMSFVPLIGVASPIICLVFRLIYPSIGSYLIYTFRKVSFSWDDEGEIE